MKLTSVLRQLEQKSFYNDLLVKYINENQNIVKSTVFQGKLYEHLEKREKKDK